MKKSTQIRTGSHCVFLLHIHLVFVAKYRRPVFSKSMLYSMQSIFEKICQNFEAALIEFEGEHDHVHLLVNYPRLFSLNLLIALKVLPQDYCAKISLIFVDIIGKAFLWSPSYFAGSCGGAPLSVIKQYIQNQKSPFE